MKVVAGLGYSSLLQILLLLFTVDAEGRHRPCLQPLVGYFLPASLADTEVPLFYPREGLSDLRNQLSLPFSDPEQKIAIRLPRGPVSRIGKFSIGDRQIADRFGRLVDEFLHLTVQEGFKEL